MEQFIKTLTENVPDIIAVAINVICYILFFVIRFKVKKSGKVLHTVVKDKVNYIDRENADIKRLMCEENVRITNELKNAYKQIDILEERLTELEKRNKKTEDVIISLIEESVE
jgi:hypothetical protein